LSIPKPTVGSSNWNVSTDAVIDFVNTVETLPDRVTAAEGTISTHTTQIAAKANTSALKPVAFSGAYTDLTGAPSNTADHSTLDALADRVAALEAVVAGGGSAGDGGVITAGFRVVQSLSEVAPTKGYPVYLDTVNKAYIGSGTGWQEFSGTAATGTGSSNAPQNMTGVVQPDNSIVLTWSGVVGATSYKLYETESPTGVAGATALTTTTSTRSPSTLRNYQYWVTALVSGVESAPSNKASVTLPYGSSPSTGGGSTGGGTGGSPAQILRLGGAGGTFNEGIGLSTGHVDIPYSQLASGYTNSPYFVANAAGTGVQFRVNMDGKTTSTNTKYARSELRELKPDGTTKAAWTVGSGTHVMEWTFKVNHIQPNKPWCTIGQLHDADSDAWAVKVKGDSTSALYVALAVYDVDQSTKLLSSYTVGDTVTMRAEMTNGTLKMYANGSLKITSTAFQGKGAGGYFKVGAYPQSLNNAGGNESASEYCSVDISNLTVSHSTYN
jgi:hypothetical protein